MKTIKNLTFAALAALAVALLFQTSLTRADAQGQRGDRDHRDHRDHRDAKVTFTKYVTALLNQPGLIATMVGAGGGDAGDGIYTGEILSRVVDPSTGVLTVVANYHFTGAKHSFSAIIHAVQAVAGVGQQGVIIGVVTDGWLKGHALTGEWTVIAPCYTPGTGVGN